MIISVFSIGVLTVARWLYIAGGLKIVEHSVHESKRHCEAACINSRNVLDRYMYSCITDPTSKMRVLCCNVVAPDTTCKHILMDDDHLDETYTTEKECRTICGPRGDYPCVKVATNRYVCCYAHNPKDLSNRCKKAVAEAKQTLDELDRSKQAGVCSKQQCKHGGSCHTEETHPFFKCICTEKYQGTNCEMKKLKGSCDCHGNGQCVSNQEEVVQTLVSSSNLPLPLAIKLSKQLFDSKAFRKYGGQVCFCNRGWRGVNCRSKCKKNKFGFFCFQTCDENCRSRRCDRSKGTCSCKTGYVSQGSICIPDTSPGSCELYCKPGHGTCQTEFGVIFCRCSNHRGGQWCEKTCSKLNPPRYGLTCEHECGACKVQPCGAMNGVCGLQRGKQRCLSPFSGTMCDEIDGETRQVTGTFFMDKQNDDVSEQEYSEALTSLARNLRIMDQLQKDIKVSLRKQLPFGRIRNIIARIKEKLRGQRKLLVSTAGIDVQFAVDFSANQTNSSLAEQQVTEGIENMGSSLLVPAVPGLGVNTDSLQILKVELVAPTEDSNMFTSGTYILAAGIAVLALAALGVAAVFKDQKKRKKRDKAQVHSPAVTFSWQGSSNNTKSTSKSKNTQKNTQRKKVNR